MTFYPCLGEIWELVRAGCVNRCTEVFHIHEWKSVSPPLSPQDILIKGGIRRKLSEGLAFEQNFEVSCR